MAKRLLARYWPVGRKPILIMKNNYFSTIVSLLFLPVVFFIACSKTTDDTSTTQIIIRMTDAPYNAQEVNVDIRAVRVNFAGDSTGWHTLNTTAGVYDLLKFQNGTDTALASGTVPRSNLKELRFILGSNNSIKINNVVYPLTIPGGDESGLKIKVNKNLASSSDSLLIDFDADASIYMTGAGQYRLKPVIKLK
ncbi:MAG: hypothetical protein JWQ40_412 [Segetibacter sp.]|jgi:hypothetical protein|nr:hypothetical protein [Segetibacter sp.]